MFQDFEVEYSAKRVFNRLSLYKVQQRLYLWTRVSDPNRHTNGTHMSIVVYTFRNHHSNARWYVTYIHMWILYINFIYVECFVVGWPLVSQPFSNVIWIPQSECLYSRSSHNGAAAHIAPASVRTWACDAASLNPNRLDDGGDRATLALRLVHVDRNSVGGSRHDGLRCRVLVGT